MTAPDPYALGFVARINMLRTPSSYVTRTIEHDAWQARRNALSEREQDARVRAWAAERDRREAAQ